MEQTPKTSFIPRQSTATVPGTARRQRSFNVFGFLAMIVFLGALILSVGVFFYKTYTEKELMGLKEQLAASRSSFQQSDIESIRELDRRIMAARGLLNQHLSVTSLFDALERVTQQNVQFTSFLFERRSSGNASLTLGGKSSRFNTVALQGLTFTSEPAVAEHMFSDINIVTDEAEGSEYIVFRTHTELDESAITYSVAAAPETTLPLPNPESETQDVSTDATSSEAESTDI